MNERICWRTPASSGSNQSSPSNGTEASRPVFFSMAWSPAAVVRPPLRVLPNSGDYAARQFPTNPATRPEERRLCKDEQTGDDQQDDFGADDDHRGGDLLGV